MSVIKLPNIMTGRTAGLTYMLSVTTLDTTPTGYESSTSNMITIPVPLTQPDTAAPPVDPALPIAVLANDTAPTGQPLTITSVTQEVHGTATIIGTSVTYTPAAACIGMDSFAYTITDGQSATATAIVTVTVLPDRAVSPVTAYNFNEGSDTTVIDASGNDNNETVRRAMWTRAGKFGGVLVFNGTSAWRDVIYKGNENYYLEAMSPHNKVPGGGTFGGNNVVTYGMVVL